MTTPPEYPPSALTVVGACLEGRGPKTCALRLADNELRVAAMGKDLTAPPTVHLAGPRPQIHRCEFRRKSLARPASLNFDEQFRADHSSYDDLEQ